MVSTEGWKHWKLLLCLLRGCSVNCVGVQIIAFGSKYGRLGDGSHGASAYIDLLALTQTAEGEIWMLIMSPRFDADVTSIAPFTKGC